MRGAGCPRCGRSESLHCRSLHLSAFEGSYFGLGRLARHDVINVRGRRLRDANQPAQDCFALRQTLGEASSASRTPSKSWLGELLQTLEKATGAPLPETDEEETGDVHRGPVTPTLAELGVTRNSAR